MEYGAITIDTNIFEKANFNFEGILLSTLDQFNLNRPFQLVLSEVVFEEIKRHLTNKIEQAKKSFVSGSKEALNHNIHECVTHEVKEQIENIDVASFVSKRLDNLKKSTGLKILSSTNINVSDLSKKYFEIRPPFEEKKKYEFPDAIALMSLEAYAKEENIKIIVVSDDKGWKAFCDNSSYLDFFEDLSNAIAEINKNPRKYIFRLEETELQKLNSKRDKQQYILADFLRKSNNAEKIIPMLEKAFNEGSIDSDINVSLDEDHYEIYDDTFNFNLNFYEFDSESIDILQDLHDKIIIKTFVRVEANVWENFLVKDYCLPPSADFCGNFEAEADYHEKLPCLISISYKNNFQNLQIEEIEFETSIFEVNFEYVEDF